MALSPDCAFVLCVEEGRLEAQAVLLVDSLRRFGGAYADSPVYAFSPRPARQMSAECRKALTDRRVEVLVEYLISPDEPYGTAARLAVCAWAEKNLLYIPRSALPCRDESSGGWYALRHQSVYYSPRYCCRRG